MEEVKLNSARNCLRYIIKAFDIKELYIPYYLCASMRISASKENCKLKFYHINTNFVPVENFEKDAFILYPDYFGVCFKTVEALCSKYPNMIIDNAHSFYAPKMGIACFNSLRKFFPILRDGAFLYTKKLCNQTFKQDEYSYSPKKLNYEEICKNEHRIDKGDIMYIPPSTLEAFKKINADELKAGRIEKFNLYHKKFKNINKLNIDLNDNDVPYCYPLLLEDEKSAFAMVKELEQQGRLIFRYWNELPSNYEESSFYRCLAAIPLAD